MKRLLALAGAALVATVFGCANMQSSDWVTMIDGETGLGNFNRIGDANWRGEQGAMHSASFDADVAREV